MLEPLGHNKPVGVADFDTKVAVVLREDLLAWQRLNVCAFLVSGLTAAAGPGAVGADYVDADGVRALPMLRQPILVFAASADKLRTVHRRALEREVVPAIYTSELFGTGHDEANREAVRSVATADLDLVGVGIRAPHRAADQVLRGLKRHP